MANPVDDFLQHKQAMDPAEAAEIGATMASGFGGSGARPGQRLPQFGATLGKGLALGGALALGSAGVAGLGAAAKKIYDAVTKKRDFESMLEANPHLRGHQEAQPEEFNRMFTALRSMNPTFSRDPVVAGAYMTEAMEQPAETRGFVAVKALREAKSPGLDPFSDAALGGFHRGVGMHGSEKHRLNDSGDFEVSERSVPHYSL
jgi:hypothetical protein